MNGSHQTVWSVNRPIHIRDDNDNVDWAGRIVIDLYRERGGYRCLVDVLDGSFRPIDVDMERFCLDALLARMKRLVAQAGHDERWPLIRQKILDRTGGGEVFNG